MAPVQVRVASIADRHNEKVEEVVAAMCKAGIRADADTRNVKVGPKKSEWRNKKIPYFAVIGDQELESGELSVTLRGNQSLGTLSPDTLIDRRAHSILSFRLV